MTFRTFEGPYGFPLSSSVWWTTKKLLLRLWLSITVSERYGKNPGLGVMYGIPADDLVAAGTTLWAHQRGLTEAVPWGDLVLKADRLRGGRAEIWTSSSVVVQHITLINHLNASFSGPLAWTAAQNKEIESHLNQGCRAELTWKESYRLHRRWIPIRQRRPPERLVKRDTERQLVQV